MKTLPAQPRNGARGRTVVLWIFCLLPPILAAVLAIGIVGYWTIPAMPVQVEGDSIIAYDPEIGFVPRPNSKTRRIDLGQLGTAAVEYHIYTDRRGARVSSPGEQTPDRADIVFVGSSWTWGHGVENQATFAFKAAQAMGMSGANLALGSYGTTHALQMLLRNRDLKPSIVIYPFSTELLRLNTASCAPSYYPFCLDFSHVGWRDGRPEIAPPRSDGVTRVQLQVEAERKGLDPLTWIVHGLDVARARLLAQLDKHSAGGLAKQEAAFEYLIGRMAFAAQEMKSELVIVYLPVADMKPPPEILSRATAKWNVPVLDLTPSFRTELAKGLPLHLNDGHPNAAGHALVADEIVAFLKRKPELFPAPAAGLDHPRVE